MIRGPFTRIEFHKLNLNSSKEVKDYLLSVGWIPTEYNRRKNDDGSWTTTSPKLTEDSFDSIEGNTGQLIARRNVLRHRRNFLQNYTDPEKKGVLSLMDSEGLVKAQGILCGTPTGRTKHRGAVCNVPGADAYLGKAVRSLYGVPEGYLMLGADLSAIEARVFGHYTYPYDDGHYANELLDGDIHTNNANMLGVSRPVAKTFLYAILYGAGEAKLASIIGCSPSQAKKRIANFWEGNPGLRKLKQVLEDYYSEYRFLKGLDGRKLFIRQDYKLLNSLVQGAAAVIFKRWGVEANRKLRAVGNSCQQAIAYHDEFDYRVCPDDIPEAIYLINQACEESGEYYNLRVPVATDFAIGNNWYDVH